MQVRLTLALALSALTLAACGSSSNSSRAVDNPPASNGGGSPVTGVITARFDPGNGVVPLPNNLLLSGTTDLTLNIPVADPANYGDPQVALNALDGWSTVTPWSASFSAPPAASTVVPGTSVRLFEVTLTGPGGGVTGIVRELSAGTEFVTALAPSDSTGRTMAIIPTSPLKQLTTYLAIITNGITDANGNDVTPDQTYFLSKRTSPLCVNGQSTDPLLPDASACALEPLRQLTNSHLAAASAAGIDPDDVVLSWTATTQSTSVVLSALASVTQPAPTVLAPTGLTTQAVGLPPVADIYIGVITLPYYLVPPSAETPTGPITGFWKASPGAYVPPFNAYGLDPTSTNLTFANPFPAKNTDVTVPVLMTVPNANSGHSKPASGWPIVIYQHGITRNRTDMLAISATLAAQGFAVVAIDLPLHGISPEDASLAPFYVENTPFGPLATEFTFNVDYVDNATGAPGADGHADASGTHLINLASLLTSRDNLRQGVADLLVLSASIGGMDIDGNQAGDFDTSRKAFVGQSLGSMVGTLFIALDETVNVATLSVPGGGIANLLNGSPTFGPSIRAGLAAAGVEAGTPDFDSFLGAAQQAIDAADPINYGMASINNAILLHEVIGSDASPPDQVIPNSVPGAPLSGTEPLIRALGLSPISSAGQHVDADGIRGVTRFIAGEHGSLLSPASSAATTVEMQTEMASMTASGGAAVIVADDSVISSQ